MLNAPPVPRCPCQPGRVRFRDWVLVHDRDLTRMMRFLRGRLLSTGSEQWGVWDWAGVRSSLERYVYAHSANRFLDFEYVK